MYFAHWKILSVIFGLALIFSISTYPVFAENYIIGKYGSFGSDLGKYLIKQGEEIQVRISGNGPMPPGTNYERVYLTITYLMELQMDTDFFQMQMVILNYFYQ